MDILEKLKTCRIIFDGGMGSMLQARGLEPGEFPETWNLRHPDMIEAIHLEYLMAGADVISANTFGANGLKYKEETVCVETIITEAVRIAKKAVQKAGHGYVALDIGPTGSLLAPYGTLEFEACCNVYKEVVRAGVSAGADLILIETMGDSYELKAAVLAAKEESDLPVFATVTLDAHGKMLTGGDVESVTALLEGLGVDVIGLNCGLGPVQLLPFVKKMAEAASVPIMVSPNAGLPRDVRGETVYDIDADEFSLAMEKIAGYASVLGGCCGTTPEYIRKMIEVCGEIPMPLVEKKNRTVITSYSRAVEFGNRPIIIGERINPTGKPRLKQALKERDMSYLFYLAVSQQESRADVLDVNVGVPGIDESLVMTEVIRELQGVTDLPLQIDTSDMAALECAMRIYNGKPMVNSVNGDPEVMDAVFPLIKKYGGVVVALCLDENGIPDTAEGRIKIAHKIYARAEEFGIDKKDILVDALCMAVSSDKNAAQTTLETVRKIRDEGGKTILGISNVSFGLPARERLNAAFFMMALQEGLSAGIVNPNSEAMMTVYDSFLVLSARDVNCEKYIDTYAKKTDIMPGMVETEESALRKYVCKGFVKEAAGSAKTLLSSKTPMEIIDQELIPALDEVGKRFEAGTLYLPQLLMSAEAAKSAFAVIKEHMKTLELEQKKGETVILASVKG
ncbi:MAG: homocysteine S-methyltransferase family protein, partial [Lachnospiraceae bacterium]|nr:homocysteine S-methyltransferase family protein [Lachnospiraceae bacterium]